MDIRPDDHLGNPQRIAAFKLQRDIDQVGRPASRERFAEVGHTTLAHAALKRSLKGRPQPRLDGLGNDQRCFVAWAQLWSYQAREERIRLLAAVDDHADTAVRGYAPLLDLDALHRAFGTRPGDAMRRRPAERVRIW